MPSNKILEEKKQVVESLAAKIQSAQAGVLVKRGKKSFKKIIAEV